MYQNLTALSNILSKIKLEPLAKKNHNWELGLALALAQSLGQYIASSQKLKLQRSRAIIIVSSLLYYYPTTCPMWSFEADRG